MKDLAWPWPPEAIQKRPENRGKNGKLLSISIPLEKSHNSEGVLPFSSEMCKRDLFLLGSTEGALASHVTGNS
jgi:hypothetical protein